MSVDSIGEIHPASSSEGRPVSATPGPSQLLDPVSLTNSGPRDWRKFEPIDMGPVLPFAVEVFIERGYHGATVRQIADRAGLSVPGMYHYGRSKQALLIAIFDTVMDDLLWRSQAAEADANGDSIAAFSYLIECLALYHAYRADLAFIGASEMRSLKLSDRERVVALRTTQQRMVDRAVAGAAAEGHFRASFPHDAARAAVTMCTAIPQWYRHQGSFTPEEVANRYVHLSLQMMEYRPARASQPERSTAHSLPARSI